MIGKRRTRKRRKARRFPRRHYTVSPLVRLALARARRRRWRKWRLLGATWPRHMLTLTQARQKYRVSRDTLWRWRKAGLLKTHGVKGKAVLVDGRALRRLLQAPK